MAVAIRQCLASGVSRTAARQVVAARSSTYEAHTEWQRFHVAGMVVGGVPPAHGGGTYGGDPLAARDVAPLVKTPLVAAAAVTWVDQACVSSVMAAAVTATQQRA